MAKNIDFMGATFPDVPRILLPQHEGGLVGFDDTSDGTAIADDIAQGKIAYVNGQKIVGTNQGGIIPTGSQTFTENGTYDVTAIAEAVVNVAGGGGGGLEYEVRTWSPASDIATATINFSKAHTNRPFCVILQDVTSGLAPSSSNLLWNIVSWYDLTGVGFATSGTATQYARVTFVTLSNSGSQSSSNFSISSLTSTGTSGLSYHLTNSSFTAYTNTTSRYWRANRTYKWIAVWKPTT